MPKLSAGLLAYRTGSHGAFEFLLVHPGGPLWKNKDANAWSIPKGEYLEDEDPQAAAEREFAEELGFPPPNGPRLDLGTVRQTSGKVVRAWAVEAGDFDVDLNQICSNEFEMEWPPKSGKRQLFPEVDRAEWMPLDDARKRVVKAQAAFFDRVVETHASSSGAN